MMSVQWQNDVNPPQPRSRDWDVHYEGEPIILWFHKKLATEYANELKAGPLQLTLKFDEPVPLESNGTYFPASGVSFRADRVFTTKRQTVLLYGDAEYDWLNGSLTIPRLGTLDFGTFLGDLSDFEDFDGNIPESATDFISYMLFCHISQFDPNLAVVDLMAL